MTCEVRKSRSTAIDGSLYRADEQRQEMAFEQFRVTDGSVHSRRDVAFTIWGTVLVRGLVLIHGFDVL